MSASTIENQYRPDHATPPGESLAELLEYYGMTQAELAARLDLTPEAVNGIRQGTEPVTPQIALGLERIFGAPASFWLAGEAAWREHSGGVGAGEAPPYPSSLAAAVSGGQVAVTAGYSMVSWSSSMSMNLCPVML